MEYPLRVLRYGLVPDTGGPGKYRGGLSIRKDIQGLTPVLFSAHSDRHRIPPRGLKGGLSGSCGRFLLNPVVLQHYHYLATISFLMVREGDVISAQTAGGGGFGSPLERDPELVEHDNLQGKVSYQEACDRYGAALTEEGLVD